MTAGISKYMNCDRRASLSLAAVSWADVIFEAEVATCRRDRR